jgi:predicted RNase H-like nuclease (RuvC/YqgF family)
MSSTEFATKTDLNDMKDEILIGVGEIIGDFATHVDKRFEQVDKRFEQVDKRFEQVDKRFEQIEHRLGHIEIDLASIKSTIAKIDARLTALEEKFDRLDRRDDEDTQLALQEIEGLKKRIAVLEKQLAG